MTSRQPGLVEVGGVPISASEARAKRRFNNDYAAAVAMGELKTRQSWTWELKNTILVELRSSRWAASPTAFVRAFNRLATRTNAKTTGRTLLHPTLLQWIDDADEDGVVHAGKKGRPFMLQDVEEQYVMRMFIRMRNNSLNVESRHIQALGRVALHRFRPEVLRDSEGVDGHLEFSQHWAVTFLGRHGNVVRKQTGDRTSSPEEVVKQCSQFYADLKKEFANVKNPRMIFNMDEFFVHFNANQKTWTWTPQGAATVQIRESKLGFTCSVTTNAAGELILVQCIFKGKQGRSLATGADFHRKIKQYHGDDGHFQNAGTFAAFAADFVAELDTMGIAPSADQPALLLLDMARQHFKEETLQQLLGAGVRVCRIPGKMTHVVQPADMYIIRAMKEGMRMANHAAFLEQLLVVNDPAIPDATAEALSEAVIRKQHSEPIPILRRNIVSYLSAGIVRLFEKRDNICCIEKSWWASGIYRALEDVFVWPPGFMEYTWLAVSREKGNVKAVAFDEYKAIVDAMGAGAPTGNEPGEISDDDAERPVNTGEELTVELNEVNAVADAYRAPDRVQRDFDAANKRFAISRGLLDDLNVVHRTVEANLTRCQAAVDRNNRAVQQPLAQQDVPPPDDRDDADDDDDAAEPAAQAHRGRRSGWKQNGAHVGEHLQLLKEKPDQTEYNAAIEMAAKLAKNATAAKAAEAAKLKAAQASFFGKPTQQQTQQLTQQQTQQLTQQQTQQPVQQRRPRDKQQRLRGPSNSAARLDQHLIDDFVNDSDDAELRAPPAGPAPGANASDAFDELQFVYDEGELPDPRSEEEQTRQYEEGYRAYMAKQALKEQE